MSPLTWPILLPLWLRLDLQARWEGATILLDLARGMLRDELLKRLGAVDAERATDMVTEAEAGEYSAKMRVAELEKQLARFDNPRKNCLLCKHVRSEVGWCRSNCSADHRAWEAKVGES